MKESLKSVADVMRAGVLTISEATSLEGAARVMREHSVHGVLVVADDGRLLGWVTAHGLLHHHAKDWRRVKSGEAVSEPCVAVAPSARVPTAIAAMLEADGSHLVVIRPGSRTPDGVVSDLDLVAHLSR